MVLINGSPHEDNSILLHRLGLFAEMNPVVPIPWGVAANDDRESRHKAANETPVTVLRGGCGMQ